MTSGLSNSFFNSDSEKIETRVMFLVSYGGDAWAVVAKTFLSEQSVARGWPIAPGSKSVSVLGRLPLHGRHSVYHVRSHIEI